MGSLTFHSIAMARKEFTIVVVRHGQATHNLDTFQRKDLVLTNELYRPIMNSPLTDLGHAQARLVAARLAKTRFDLGFASDLIRAWDTALAIVAANPSLESVKECRYLRERNAGDFEYNSARSKAQYTVEDGVEDRDLLTWRIPGGDSILSEAECPRLSPPGAGRGARPEGGEADHLAGLPLCVDARALQSSLRDFRGVGK